MFCKVGVVVIVSMYDVKWGGVSINCFCIGKSVVKLLYLLSKKIYYVVFLKLIYSMKYVFVFLIFVLF